MYKRQVQEASKITATVTAAPSTGITRCLNQFGGPSRRLTTNQPTTEACSRVKATSAPTSTTDTSWSSPSSRRAAHTAATSVMAAATSSAGRGVPSEVRASIRGSRRSRAIANTSRPAAACPASAAKAAPIALLTATRSCSQDPTADSTAS